MREHPHRYPVYAGGVLIAVSLVAWIWTTGDPLDYGGASVPPGQRLYIASKLFGLLAMAAFWLQALGGLARRTPALRAYWALTQRAHRNLGVASVTLVIIHAGLFVGAVSLRSNHLALGPLVPDFTGSVFAFYVSLGVLGLILLLLVPLAGVLRRHGGLWAWLHRVWVAAFALGIWHALSIGTETRLGPMLYVYLVMAATLASAVILWVVSEAIRLREAGRRGGIACRDGVS